MPQGHAIGTMMLAARDSSSKSSSERLIINGTPVATTKSSNQTGSGSFRTQDPHDEKLYEELRACEHWQDVLEVVADEGNAMSTRRCVRCLCLQVLFPPRLQSWNSFHTHNLILPHTDLSRPSHA